MTRFSAFETFDRRPQTFPGVGFKRLSTARCRRNKCVRERHQPPQRRLRPRQPAAVRSNQFIDSCYRQRRLRLRHSPRPHARDACVMRKMAIGVLLGPPSHRFRIEPVGPACQTLRRSLVSGSRLRQACFTRRQPAQTSLCRVAPKDSVNRRRPLLEFYVCFCARVSCYRTLPAYVQSSVPVSRSSSLYWDRERPP